MNKNILIAILLSIILATAGTLVAVRLSEKYEIVSNEELYNITQNAYLRGTLYVAESGIIPYVNNNTIQTIELAKFCDLNNNGGKQ